MWLACWRERTHIHVHILCIIILYYHTAYYYRYCTVCWFCTSRWRLLHTRMFLTGHEKAWQNTATVSFHYVATGREQPRTTQFVSIWGSRMSKWLQGNSKGHPQTGKLVPILYSLEAHVGRALLYYTVQWELSRERIFMNIVAWEPPAKVFTKFRHTPCTHIVISLI